MKGSLRQRSAGSWELTVDLGRDAVGKRRRRHETVRGTKAQAQRRLRELLSHPGPGHRPAQRQAPGQGLAGPVAQGARSPQPADWGPWSVTG